MKFLSRDITSKLNETPSIPKSSQFSEALYDDSEYVCFAEIGREKLHLNS